MKYSRMLATFILLCLFATSIIEGQHQEPNKAKSCTIKGKVFRSDSNEAISNSYILLIQEKDSPTQVEHFDVRTDGTGDYRFKEVPAGKYTVSIYAWFPAKGDVPCRNSPEAKTVGAGKVTVEWQWKSQAFMEVVTINGFSVEAGQERVKDFDLVCH